MRIGQIRQKIALQRASTTIAGQWDAAGVIWAEVLTDPGENPLKRRIRCRWKRNLTVDLRLVYNGETLAMIAPPADPDGRRRELLLVCTAIDQSETTEGLIAASGGIVTFSGAGALVYDPQTGLWTGTEIAEYSAWGLQSKPTDERLGDNLVAKRTETLEVPALYNGALIPRPVAGMTFTRVGASYTIETVDMTAPDGTPEKYVVVGVR